MRVPCDSDARDDDFNIRPKYEYELESDNDWNARTIKKLHALLCFACRALIEKQFDFDINPELSQWWSQNKQYDDERIQRKRAAEEKKRREIGQCELLIAKPWNQLTRDDRQLLKKHGYA